MAQTTIGQLPANTLIAGGDLFIHTDVSDGNNDKHVRADSLATYILGQAQFVDFTSAETISGNKTFTGDTRINDLGVNTTAGALSPFNLDSNGQTLSMVVSSSYSPGGVAFEPTFVMIERNNPPTLRSISSIQSRATNSSGGQSTYSAIRTHVTSNSSFNERAYLGFKVAVGETIGGNESEDVVRITPDGLTLNQTGGSITFPGGDVLTYSEGTWTPATPTANTSLSIPVGRYTRIGNMVFLSAVFRVISTSGVFLRVSGLPFQASVTTTLNDYFIGNYYKTGNSVGTGFVRLSEGETTLAFINPSPPQTADDMTIHAEDLNGDNDLHTVSLNITYETDQ